MGKNTGEKTMQVTKEQLEVYAFAKRSDEKRPELTQIQLERGGRAVATNGKMIAIVKREPLDGKAGGRDMRVPTNIARMVLDHAKREGVVGIELHPEADGPTFYVTDPEHEEKEGIATRYHPVAETFPNYEAIVSSAVKGEPRARIALESTLLATICSMRNKVGGQGAIKLEVRGELDPAVASWNDDKGHVVTVVLMPMKLEPWEWAGEPAPQDEAGEEAPRGGQTDLPEASPAREGEGGAKRGRGKK